MKWIRKILEKLIHKHKHNSKLKKYLIISNEILIPIVGFNLYVKSCTCGHQKVFREISLRKGKSCIKL